MRIHHSVLRMGVREDRACKPDFVATRAADGHFSAAKVALRVTVPFPETAAANPKTRRAGFVEAFASDFAFCLALHRTGVTSAAASPRRWCAFTLRLCSPHRFTSSGGNGRKQEAVRVLEIQAVSLECFAHNCFLLSAAASCCIVSVALSRLSHRCASGRR